MQISLDIKKFDEYFNMKIALLEVYNIINISSDNVIYRYFVYVNP